MNKVKKIGLLEDAVHLAENIGIVYFGIAGAVRYKAARRVHYYLQCRKEKDKNNGRNENEFI